LLSCFLFVYCTDNQQFNSMDKQNKLVSIFNQVEDPRSHINKLHNLIKTVAKL